jgi:hypothetical protein
VYVCVRVCMCVCVRVFVWHRIGVAHAPTELVDIVLQNDAYTALCVVHPCVMCCRSSCPPMVTTSALAHVLLDSSAASK